MRSVVVGQNALPRQPEEHYSICRLMSGLLHNTWMMPQSLKTAVEKVRIKYLQQQHERKKKNWRIRTRAIEKKSTRRRLTTGLFLGKKNCNNIENSVIIVYTREYDAKTGLSTAVRRAQTLCYLRRNREVFFFRKKCLD